MIMFHVILCCLILYCFRLINTIAIKKTWLKIARKFAIEADIVRIIMVLGAFVFA